MNARRPWAGALLASLIALVCCVAVTQKTSGPVVVASPQSNAPQPPGASIAPAARVPLPNKNGTLKFAVIGDNGTGDKPQYDVGAQMAAWQERFPFKLVVMMGDNIYGSDRPQDYDKKFAMPYKLLLDRGVKFQASLGNHDSREQANYAYFNMDGKLYYTFKPGDQDARFFVLETTYMDPDQLKWIEDELKKSNDKWKIAYFHHPPYSSSRRHGSQVKLREVLEPLFVRYNVSLVLTGHDHAYERTWPQNGIQYFVVGSSGQLRPGDLRKGSPLTAFGNDRDYVFVLMEIDGDNLTYNAITHTGKIIDSGVVVRRK